MVEQRPFKPVVEGSSPSAPTIFERSCLSRAIEMIAPEFLAMLVCPATRQSLRVAAAAELEVANAAIAAGELRNRGGNQVAEPLTDALATADGAWLYPVQEGIPILLSPEAIPGESAETP